MADISQSYDHPTFLVTQQDTMPLVQAPATSLTDFALFRCRNKCIVTSVTVTCRSLPSAITTFSLQVMRGATTIAAATITSFSVVGNLAGKVITLVSSNTLATSTETVSLELDSTEKGKFDVIWEYRLIP